MIGEAIGSWMLRKHHQRHRRALMACAFDGVCPKCGNPMQFKGHGETYGGRPQDRFVCHACRSQVWKRIQDPGREENYALLPEDPS